jgi:plastocyanin
VPPLRVLIAGLVTAALLAGCGDEPVRIESRTLSIKLDEYRLMPQDVVVEAGRLRLVATNVGRTTHNLKVVKRDAEDLESLPEEIGGTRTAQPGESDTITFEAKDLPPGEYRMVCTIANHDDLGQYGTLIVEEG